MRVEWVCAAQVRARGGARCGVAEREREFGARPISAERPEGDVGRLSGTAGVVSRRSLERRARDRAIAVRLRKMARLPGMGVLARAWRGLAPSTEDGDGMARVVRRPEDGAMRTRSMAHVYRRARALATYAVICVSYRAGCIILRSRIRFFRDFDKARREALARQSSGNPAQTK